MSQLLDWVNSNVEPSTMSEWKKLELVLLCHLRPGPSHPLTSKIQFNNICYQNIAALLQPGYFSQTEHPTTDFIGQPEVIYLMKLRGELIQEFIRFDYDNPLYMLHQVYFWSDMGREPFFDHTAETYLLSLLGTDPWEGKEKPYPEILHDWWGEILIALKCMECDLPQEYVDFLTSIDYNNLSEVNYHAYLVKEIFEII